MKAELQPLEGKYYGTKVKVTYAGDKSFEVTFWDSGDFTPSLRALDSDEFPHCESMASYDDAIELINEINL
jgi:hypothetical protein